MSVVATPQDSDVAWTPEEEEKIVKPATSGWQSLVGIAGSAVGVFSLALAIQLCDPPFNFVTNPPSNLGWSGRGPAAVYLVGISVATLLLTVYAIWLTRWLWTRSRRREHTLLVFSLGAFIVIFVAVCFLVAVPDQNGRYGYLHIAAACFYVLATPLTTVGYTTAFAHITRRRSLVQTFAAFCVVFFAASVATLLVPLFRQFSIASLFSMITAGGTHDDRKPALDRLASLSATFPLSELCLIVSFYLWLGATAFLTWK